MIIGKLHFKFVSEEKLKVITKFNYFVFGHSHTVALDNSTVWSLNLISHNSYFILSLSECF